MFGVRSSAVVQWCILSLQWGGEKRGERGQPGKASLRHLLAQHTLEFASDSCMSDVLVTQE